MRKWRSDRNPRGAGTFALIAREEGLYIGDDTDFLNGTEHQKFKFLPITGETIFRPAPLTLPTQIVSASTSLPSQLVCRTYNGSTVDASGTTLDQQFLDARAALFVDGRLFYINSQSTLMMSPFANGTFGSSVAVDLLGLQQSTIAPWRLNQVIGMFFELERSRVYYTKSGDSRLYWRAFTPEGTYFGSDEYVADGGSLYWHNVRGMALIDGQLHFGDNNGRLNKARFDDGAVDRFDVQTFSGLGYDSLVWGQGALLFVDESGAAGPRVRPNMSLRDQVHRLQDATRRSISR